MDLDDLATEIEIISSEPGVQRLADYLRKWKTDNSTVAELASLVEHYLGNTWLSTDAVHSKVYSLWSSFKIEVINYLPGMTMNERLSCFSLLSAFDWGTKERKAIIYAKLHARP